MGFYSYAVVTFLQKQKSLLLCIHNLVKIVNVHNSSPSNDWKLSVLFWENNGMIVTFIGVHV